MTQEHTAIEVTPEEMRAFAKRYEDTMGLTRDGAIRRIGALHDGLLDFADRLAQPSITPAAGGGWECFCCPTSFDMWRVRKIGERDFEQGFLVVNKESAEGLRDYLNALSATPTPEPQPASPSGLGAMAKGTEPAGCHVLGGRFDNDVGEWHFDVVATPLTFPFTHWWPLPDLAAALAAPATADDARPSNGALVEALAKAYYEREREVWQREHPDDLFVAWGDMDFEAFKDQWRKPARDVLAALATPEQDRSTSKGEGE